MPQHVTAVLPSPLRVNASSPPCGLPYAVESVAVKRTAVRSCKHQLAIQAACQLSAAAVMLAITLAITGAPTPHVTAESVAAIAVLGIIGTGLAYVLNYQIITSEGATVASTVTYLLPVVAIELGVVVLGESITVTTLAGIALVLIGVALTRRRVRQTQAEHETRPNDPAGNGGKEDRKMRRQHRPASPSPRRIRKAPGYPDREFRNTVPQDEDAAEPATESPGDKKPRPPLPPRRTPRPGTPTGESDGMPEYPPRWDPSQWPPSRGPF